jgi:hypothetical protein
MRTFGTLHLRWAGIHGDAQALSPRLPTNSCLLARIIVMQAMYFTWIINFLVAISVCFSSLFTVPPGTDL